MDHHPGHLTGQPQVHCDGRSRKAYRSARKLKVGRDVDRAESGVHNEDRVPVKVPSTCKVFPSHRKQAALRPNVLTPKSRRPPSSTHRATVQSDVLTVSPSTGRTVGRQAYHFSLMTAWTMGAQDPLTTFSMRVSQLTPPLCDGPT